MLGQDGDLATKPFHLCNLIEVKIRDDQQAAIKKLKQSFIVEGYQLLSADNQTMTVMGKVKINDTLEMTVTAVVTDRLIAYSGTYAYLPVSAAQASGSYTPVLLETVQWKVEYKGKANSGTRKAFAQMNALASAYGGKTVYFFQ